MQYQTFFGLPARPFSPAADRRAICLAWLARRQDACRRGVMGLAIAIALVDWVRVSMMTGGDFLLHHGFARRFWGGIFLYADGVHVPYPPFWGMAFVPLTAMSLPVARTVAFPVALLALALLLGILNRMTEKPLPLSRDGLFWTTTVALFLGSRFIEREMQDCGPNMALVALTWLGIYCWTRGRDDWGGVCLGFAAALKCTPAIFIAYFALKRQWRMVGWSTLAAACFTLAPAVWMGWDEYVLHMQTWTGNVLGGMRQPDPSMGILGEEKVQNLALRTALARFLIHLPPGHLSHLDHPLYVEFLNLPHALAGTLIRILTLMVVAALAWQMRRRISSRSDLGVVWECAIVSLAALLLSPITWEQHCVAAVSALYLVARTLWSQGGLAPWMGRVLVAFVFFVLVLNRELMGRDLSYILLSYHVITWSLVGLLAVCLACGFRTAGSPLLAARRGDGAGE